MAIEETGTREKEYWSNSTTVSITVPADCTLVIVAGAWWDSGATDQTTALSIDGDSLTKVTSQENPDSEMETDLWRLVNPSTGAQTLTITCSGALGLQWTGFVVYYKGINTASPIRASDSEWETNYGADPFATAAITSASGDLMFCLVGSYNIDADAAPTGKGQTEVDNHNVGSGYAAFGTKAGGAPSVIMWGSGASGGISACSIKAAGAAAQTLIPGGIASLEALGTLKANHRIEPSAISSSEVFGTLKANHRIEPSAISSLEALGTPKLNHLITAAGIASTELFGTPTMKIFLLPSSISSLEAFGTPEALDFILNMTGIPSSEVFGAVTVVGGVLTTERVFIVTTPGLVNISTSGDLVNKA